MDKFFSSLKKWFRGQMAKATARRREKKLLRKAFWSHFRKGFNWRNVLKGLITYGYLTICLLIVVIPILWLVTAAFTNVRAITFENGVPTYLLTNMNALNEVVDTYLGANQGVGEFGWFPLIPDFRKFSFNNFTFLFTYGSGAADAQAMNFLSAFLRTLGIAVLNTALVVFFSALTGFAFSRYRFKGKKTALLSLLTLQMFPAFMGMIAMLGIFRTFQWTNNWIALTLIYVAGAIPYNTFIVRGYMKNVSKSLDEAAAIDGASNFQILVKIIFPLAIPILGFLAVNAFMSPWLDYIFPSVLMNAKPTVGVILYMYIGGGTSALVNNPVVFMAGALLIALPIMLVQIYMQRFIVFGLTTGADKG